MSSVLEGVIHLRHCCRVEPWETSHLVRDSLMGVSSPDFPTMISPFFPLIAPTAAGEVNEKTIERRKRIAEETFTTEQSYVSSLGVVMEVSVTPPQHFQYVCTCELLDNYSQLDSCSWWSRWGINGVADEGPVETEDAIWDMVLCPKLKVHI